MNGEGEDSSSSVAVEGEKNSSSRILGAGNAHFELFVQSVKDYAIFLLDVDGKVASWNAGAEELKGYRGDEILGQHFGCFHTLEGVEAGQPARELELAAAQGRHEAEGFRLRKDGSRFWASISLTALHDATGKLVGFGKVTRDLSERVRTAEQFRLAIEAAPTGMIMADKWGRIVLVNAEIEKLFGYPREELIGKPVELLVPERFRGRHPELRAGFLTSPRARRMGAGRDLYGLRKEGTEMPIEIGLNPLQTPDGDFVLSSVVDITERRDLEQRVSITERLASIGTLAAGMAHELNNPLASVAGNVEFAIESLGFLKAAVAARPDSTGSVRTVDDTIEALLDAATAGERVRRIVQDLKTFSRTDRQSREALDLPAVLEAAVKMTENQVRHNARIVKQYEPTPLVDANERALQQVFMNLLVNAAQAIGEGKASSNEIRIATSVDAAGRVVVEIADTGPGIPEPVRSRIFDPFFTTKPVGTGVGLGLSICHSILASFGGEIAAESTVGVGATFRVSLIPASRSDESVKASRPLPLPLPSRRGRLLVVDDEAAIGRTLARILGHDHDVVTETEGRAALQRIARGEAFDVIFCDLMMPDMTGMDLYEALESTQPDLAKRVVFLTGGAFSERAAAFLTKVANATLSKPFSSAVVRDAVANCLKDGDG